MWLRKVLSLCAIGLGFGILMVLFLPVSVVFCVIAIILLVVGFAGIFC